MKVFSACMKIIRKNLLLILLYNLMFAAIALWRARCPPVNRIIRDLKILIFIIR